MCLETDPDTLEQLRDLPWTDCQLLWLSRLHANTSLVQAHAVFNQSEICKRRDLVHAWGGELAWLEGDLEEARLHWETLGPTQLSDWGYGEILRDQGQRGRFLLEAALRVPPSRMSADQLGQVYHRLGEWYRQNGDWMNAISMYRSAIELSPQDTASYLHLAQAYRSSGHPVKAVEILTEGVPFLPSNYPRWVSEYYVQIGLNYVDVGLDRDAERSFDVALQWLAKDEGVTSDQERYIRLLMSGLNLSPEQP